MLAVAEFSERFSELIGDESYTKVGDRIGLSKQTVSAYASGERNPKKPTIQAIALHYGVNPAWLIGLDAPKYTKGPTPSSESGPKSKTRVEIESIMNTLDETKLKLLLERAELLDQLQMPKEK